MAEARRITVDEPRKRMEAGEDFTFLDARNPKTWAESAVMTPGALRAPLENFEQHLPPIPKERNIITYCTWPHEASSAGLGQKLSERGYKSVWALQGGFVAAWRTAGMRVAARQQAA